MGLSRPKRTFDREFKLRLMHQLESGERRPGQICREHALSHSLLKRWRDQYAEFGDQAWSDSQQPNEAAEDSPRVRELEAALGRAGRPLGTENELLRRALRQAEKGGFRPGRSGR